MEPRNVAAMIHRHAAFRIQPVWTKESTYQRNRRERPMCRSAPERTELFPIIPENVPHFCHSDRSVSGVEESTTLEEGLTQDKICNLGRFLDSLHSLGMTCRGVVLFCLHGLYPQRSRNGT